jgi:SAM-dependent methyltransferase
VIRAWTVVFGGLALLWAGDALRLRRRANALCVLPPSDEPVSPSHRFLVRKGVVVDEPTRRAASAYARAEGLSVLDLVPQHLPVGRAMFLLQAIDIAPFRADRLATAVSVGEAMLIDDEVLGRMRQPTEPVADVLELVKVARRAKLHATTTMDFAVAPSLHVAPEDRPRTRALIALVFGDIVLPVILLQVGLALAGPWVARIAGSIALAAMHLQSLLALAGTPLRPSGLVKQTLFRSLLDLFAVLDWRGGGGQTNDKAREESRATYAKLAEPGTARFFEARREDCPLCHDTALRPKLAVRDLLQGKPGRFALERCDACGHIFQNPRLSIEGLGYYYRDFYDGLGEDDLEAIFRSTSVAYRDRAKMVKGVLVPKNWLDVGTGHGHFCNVAREVLPETTFDGVDFTESVEEAQRRGWIAKSYRALFPEIAGEIGAKYDAVSMSHYLEHTREPREEIEAAAKVLRPGGVLLIEVPDPDSRMGSLLGRLWLPWFQPQHQHFLSVGRLEKILREEGFEPEVWHRGEAHQICDFFLAVALLMNQIAPPLGRPWRRREGTLARIWYRIAWFLALPLLALSSVLDKLIAPLQRRPGWSNTFRVVARRAK